MPFIRVCRFWWIFVGVFDYITSDELDPDFFVQANDLRAVLFDFSLYTILEYGKLLIWQYACVPAVQAAQWPSEETEWNYCTVLHQYR